MAEEWIHPDFSRFAFSLIEEFDFDFYGDYSLISFAHELGHNFGCAHDRENVHAHGAFPYAYGYKFEDIDQTEYGTVMSYTTNYLPYFSNPNLTYNNHALGNDLTHQEPAYNALAISQTKALVSNFSEPILYWEYFEHEVTDQQVLIAPNPASSYAIVSWKERGITRADFNLYNMAGERILRFNKALDQSNMFMIDINDVSPGIYIYQLKL